MPLDEVGLAQADRAASLLAALSPVAIVASDLQRAAQTAAALSAVTGLPVVHNKGLRENHAGAWEGLDRDELQAQFGDELDQWSRGGDVRPGGGELRSEVAARAVEAIERALVDIAPGETLVVATHGGTGRCAITSMIGLDVLQVVSFGVLSNCSWSVLVETGWSAPQPAWRLVEYNAGSLPTPVLSDDR